MHIKYGPVFCQVEKDQIAFLKQFLWYNKEVWIRGKYRRERKEYKIFLVDKNGLFLSGFLPRVISLCKSKEIDLGIDGFEFVVEQPCKAGSCEVAQLHGVDLRSYQTSAVDKIKEQYRGVIVFPTGSGKTIIMLSLINCFPNISSLILVPNTTIFEQTITEALRFFPEKDIGVLGNGMMDPSRINIATIQTFYKLPVSEFHKKIELVIVDECHHVSSFDGIYAEALRKVPANIRVGFTATFPYKEQGRLSLEGHIGPKIMEIKSTDLMEIGLLARPKIKFFKIPYNRKVHDFKRYPDVYSEGIVNNSLRNYKIALEVKNLVEKESKTVLVLVTQKQHGENILRMCHKVLEDPSKCLFIYGDTVGSVREELRIALNKKKINTAITTCIWKEGIDIPTLDSIINASGGKSEIQTIQSIGRGFRVAEGKSDIIFIDFFDPSHYYLVEHFGQRLTLYFQLGWL